MSDFKWIAILFLGVLLLIMGGMLGEQYIDKLPDNSGNMLEVPKELTFFNCTFIDEKGRPVDAVVLVNKEDIPTLMQGRHWNVLVNTDDPRWNLDEQKK